LREDSEEVAKLRGERAFNNVVAGSELFSAVSIAGHIRSGMNNDGEIFECGMRVHPFENFESADEGHAEIENDGKREWIGVVIIVRRLAGKVIDGLLVVGDETEFVRQAGLGEDTLEKENFVGVVLCEEHYLTSMRHGLSGPTYYG